MADERKSVVVFTGASDEGIVPSGAAEIDGVTYLRGVPVEVTEEEAEQLRERVKGSAIRLSFREMSAERVEAKRAEAGVDEEPIAAPPSSAEEVATPNPSGRGRGRS